MNLKYPGEAYLSRTRLEPLYIRALLTISSLLKVLSSLSISSLRFSPYSSSSAVILQSNLSSPLYSLRILLSAFFPINFLPWLTHLLLYLYIRYSIFNISLCPLVSEQPIIPGTPVYFPQLFHFLFPGLCSPANISGSLSIYPSPRPTS